MLPLTLLFHGLRMIAWLPTKSVRTKDGFWPVKRSDRDCTTCGPSAAANIVQVRRAQKLQRECAAVTGKLQISAATRYTHRTFPVDR